MFKTKGHKMYVKISSDYQTTTSINSNFFETDFNKQHFILKDKTIYNQLQEQFSADFKQFKDCFLKLQHFTEFPYVDEGIEVYKVNLLNRNIENDLCEEGRYVAQHTLYDLPCQNQFLKNLILKICEPLEFYSSALHVVVKFHRRKIEKGNSHELLGLKPHKDFDSNIIVMLKIDQINLSGGKNRISDEFGNILIEDSISEPGSMIYVNNEKLFHELTSMKLMDPCFSGYRDIVILEIKKS